jgi:hypothetical protein
LGQLRGSFLTWFPLLFLEFGEKFRISFQRKVTEACVGDVWRRPKWVICGETVLAIIPERQLGTDTSFAEAFLPSLAPPLDGQRNLGSSWFKDSTVVFVLLLVPVQATRDGSCYADR